MPFKHQRSLRIDIPKAKPIDIIFQDISVVVPVPKKTEKKCVLKGISGSFKHGELTAIMGPSGAGKSTLLNILTGYQLAYMSGKVYMNDLEIKPGRSDSRKISCYIMQEDNVNPWFTVTEIMQLAAECKLGPSFSMATKLKLIDEILESLSLTPASSTFCGRLSGGQKKRLCIALELIDNPPIMYLDEPTTGLDSSSTLQMANMLRRLAKEGRNIVCTIHQPSATILEMFDHIYLLSSGSCAYQGSPQNIVPYLQTVGLQCPKYHNPADFMLDVVCGEFGEFSDQLILAAKDSTWRTTSFVTSNNCKNNEHSNPPNMFENKALVIFTFPNEWWRFKVLMKRSLVQLHRDWTAVYLKLVLHVAVACMMGLLFANCGRDGDKALSNLGFLMSCIVYQCFTSIMPAALKFPAEINMLRRELFNNWYTLKTYYAAFMFITIPIQMFFSIAFLTTAYYLTGQILEADRFIRFVLPNLLITVISECLGLALGTAGNPVNGIFWGSVILAIMILLAGFLAILTHVPTILYYFSYLSFMRYSFEGLVFSIYGYNREVLPCPETEEYCHLRYPTQILEELGMVQNNYWFDWSVLVINFLVYCGIAYIMLREKVKSRS